MKRILLSLALAALTITVYAQTPQYQIADHNCGPDGNGGLNCAKVQGVVNAALASGSDIGAKVNAAQGAGNVEIEVPAGTYTQTSIVTISQPNVKVRCDKGALLLLGASVDRQFNITGTNDTVEGCDIEQPLTGGLPTYSAYGIVASSATNVSLFRNRLLNNSKGAILLNNVNGGVVFGNNAAGMTTGDGVYLEGNTTGVLVYGNTLDMSSLTTWAHGIGVHSATAGTAVTYSAVENNTIFNGYSYCIETGAFGGNAVVGVNVDNNKCYQKVAAPGFGGYSIGSTASHFTWNNNLYINTVGAPNLPGIEVVVADHATVADNTIIGGAFSINSSNNVSFTANNMMSPYSNAILWMGASYAHDLSRNTITGNTLDVSNTVSDIPAAPTLTASTTGGTLADNTTYTYEVSAVETVTVEGTAFQGAEGLPSTTTAVTTGSSGGTNSVTVSWPTVTNATAYNVYGRKSSSLLYMGTVAAPATSFVDTGSVTPSGSPNSLPRASVWFQCNHSGIDCSGDQITDNIEHLNANIAGQTGLTLEADTGVAQMVNTLVASNLIENGTGYCINPGYTGNLSPTLLDNQCPNAGAIFPSTQVGSWNQLRMGNLASSSQATTFTPTAGSAGWYTVATNGGSTDTGRLRWYSSYDNKYTSFEIAFSWSGNTLNVLTDNTYNTGVVTAIRIGGGHLDVQLASPTTPGTVYLVLDSPKSTLVTTPVLGAAAPSSYSQLSMPCIGLCTANTLTYSGSNTAYGEALKTVSTPSSPTLTTATTGGTLADATAYYYQITATTSAGETLPSTQASITTGSGGGTNTVTVTWTPVTGATGYNVYGRTSTGSLKLATITTATTMSWTDTGSVTPSGAIPTTNTSGQSKATNFISTVATGTQPYATTSTTLNTNLNADMVGGVHTGNVSAGKTMCWKDSTHTGYCSTVVGSDGSCTCN